MKKTVTEQMISDLIDGELSPADQAMVEQAISADATLREIYDSYRESSELLRESAEHVKNLVQLPGDFTYRVMAEIDALIDLKSTEAESTEENGNEKNSVASLNSILQTDRNPGSPDPLRGPANGWSRRTWVEIIAATAALVAILVVWQSQRGIDPERENLTAKSEKSESKDQNLKQGVRALGSSGDLSGPVAKENASKSLKRKSGDSPAVQSSREFSVFVKEQARPSIDRFWIMSDYEVSAPEGTLPTGDGGPVNVLLIDAKRADAIKFFAQIKKWDPDFRVFQHEKSGTASWLAPLDLSKVGQSEGDYWKLQIVLIRP